MSTNFSRKMRKTLFDDFCRLYSRNTRAELEKIANTHQMHLDSIQADAVISGIQLQAIRFELNRKELLLALELQHRAAEDEQIVDQQLHSDMEDEG